MRCLMTAIELTDDEVSIEETTVGQLRSIIQNKQGIPVSMFRLRKKNDNNRLFDSHHLSYYGIQKGDSVVLEVRSK